MQVTVSQLQAWCGVTEHAQAETVITSMTTDSRAVVPGSLFVALRGERFDAHDFLEAVAAQGAAAVLVERIPAGLTVPAIVVPDTRVALGLIAHHWRMQFAIPVIGVTGSNGKTTVKEMLASILEAGLGQQHYLATRGNFNNDIGVPLTLMRLESDHRAAVIELGMNHPGEITVLAGIAKPTVGLVNNAQREHQEFMATVEAVARENGDVMAHLPDNGTAVFPAGDAFTSLWKTMAGQRRVMTFGLTDDADVQGSYVAQQFGSALTINAQVNGVHKQFKVQLNAAGEHNVRNALAATACALAIGVDDAAIVRGLQAFSPVNGRLQRKTGTNGALVIDDTYNANPDSARAAIDVLAQAISPRVLVLGDMGEVGDEGQKFHEEIGLYAREQGIEHFFGVGELMQYAVTAFNSVAGAGIAQHFGDVTTMYAAVKQVATPQATVLVKGSRFMKMERVVQYLVEQENTMNLQGAH